MVLSGTDKRKRCKINWDEIYFIKKDLLKTGTFYWWKFNKLIKKFKHNLIVFFWMIDQVAERFKVSIQTINRENTKQVAKVPSKMDGRSQTLCSPTKICRCGEMVDTWLSKSHGEICVGSSPTSGTTMV